MDGSLPHPPPGPGRTRLELGGVPGCLALSGDLDVDTRDAVRAALAAALTADGPTEIVVDLGAVRFLDAGTVRLLVQAQQRALDLGRRLRVTGADDAARQVIEAAGAGPRLLTPPPALSLTGDRLGATGRHRQATEDRSRLLARLHQQAIDAEVRDTRRTLLNRLRRTLRADPAALSDEGFLAVADVHTVLDAIIVAATVVGAADACHLQLCEPRTATLHLARRRGLTEQLRAYVTTDHPGRPPAYATAAETGEPVIADDVSRSPVYAGQPVLQLLRDAGIRAVHTHPLHDDAGRLLGVLSFHYRRTTPHRGDPELVAWWAARALARVTPHHPAAQA